MILSVRVHLKHKTLSIKVTLYTVYMNTVNGTGNTTQYNNELLIKLPQNNVHKQ